QFAPNGTSGLLDAKDARAALSLAPLSPSPPNMNILEMFPEKSEKRRKQMCMELNAIRRLANAND
ncbi:MAG: hypothetical protein M1608_17280, partial [Candidatus Omnitrophica bacterium]|nr:hypothetical protein [Candidatus Omnitrophota bacterium]